MRTRLSIKWRVSLISIGTIAGITVLFTLFIYFSLSKWMMEQQDHAALTSTQHIALAYPGNIEQGSNNSNDKSQSWLSQFASKNQTFYIIGLNGKTVATLGNAFGVLPHSIGLTHAQKGTLTHVVERGHSFVRIILPSRSESGDTVAWVISYASTDVVQAYITALVRVLIFGSLLALILAGLSGYVMSFVALRPITDIIRRMHHMDAFSIKGRLPHDSGRDEIAELAKTFNEMLDRIRKTIEKQNEFIADASHEFRSPLTVIEGYTNLLDRWGKDDPAVTERSIGAIKKEAARLRRLTNGLLQLASLANVQLESTPCDAKRVVEEVVLQFSEVFQRNIAFECSDVSVMTEMQSEHLHQVTAILLQNAVKHTSEGQGISVRAVRQKSGLLLAVEDKGEGIDPEHLPHVFDRFYRSDRARSRSTEGFGLGLAIAKEIVGLYQGTIQVVSERGKGTVFSVTIPAR